MEFLFSMFDSLFGADEAQRKEMKAKLYPMQLSSHHSFPERLENRLRHEEPIGLACSGGGSRSHTLTSGYLRGLASLREEEGLKDFDYLSCVSGGSWAGSIYCFSKLDEELLLGKSTDPKKLTLKELSEGNPGKLAATVTTKKFLGLAQTFKNYIGGTEYRDLWTKMIRDCILEEFDLHDTMIALDDSHVKEIKSRNPHLEDTKFQTIAADRPFPIVNVTLLGPDNYNSGYGNSFQVTPLYSGVPFYNNSRRMDYFPVSAIKALLPNKLTTKDDAISLTIGGGFVETFAVNSPGPIKKRNQYFNFELEAKETELHPVEGDYFFLQDAVGASSAAFAAAFSNISKVLDDLNPMISYFPIFCEKIPQFSRFQSHKRINIGDGGLIDNSGVPPLLQRKVKKIVCFFNSSTPLDLNFEENRFIEYDFLAESTEVLYKCAAEDFLGLFGVVELADITSNYTSITCFRKNDLNVVMKKLTDNAKSGKGAVARVNLEVLPNKTWNIEGGYFVDICFVYNCKVDKFTAELPQDTAKELEKGEKGIFEHFPYYQTVFQNLAPFSLQKAEVSLLSAQAEFVIKQNRDIFVDILTR
eukprot:snap_masked-scaffold_36-processed-gene-2.92-mRNA-1 protein AED:0.05 eAED:0.05 QI:0/-1/0/1/-1/1/1/0/584